MPWKNGIHIPPKGFKSPYGPPAAQRKKLRKKLEKPGGTIEYSHILKTDVARKNAFINGHEVRTMSIGDGTVSVFIDDDYAIVPVDELDQYIKDNT